MKKLLQLLIIGSAGMGVTTGSIAVIGGYSCSRKTKRIWQVLAKFTAQQPLQIRWIADQLPANDPKATIALRAAIVQQDKTKTITQAIAQHITFDASLIMQNQTISVQATYDKVTATIAVQESKTPLTELVRRVLARFMIQQPLQLGWIAVQVLANDPKATTALRAAIVQQDKTKAITQAVAQHITFDASLIMQNQTTIVQATYDDKVTVTIAVREDQVPGNKVLDFLKNKFNSDKPLFFWTRVDYADEDANHIRHVILVKSDSPLITEAVVNELRFDHQKMPQRKKFLMTVHCKNFVAQINAVVIPLI